MRVKRKAIIVSVVVLLLVFGGGLFARSYLASKKSQPANYYTIAAQRGTVEVVVSGSGSAKPAARKVVRAEVAGDVIAIFVEKGQRIEPGSTIALMRNDDLEVKVVEARADLRQAELKLQEMLHGAPAQSASPGVSAITTLASPASGRISSISVARGDEVRQGQVLAVITNTETITFEVRVTPPEAELVSAGDRAEIRMDGFDGALECVVQGVADFTISDGETWWTPVWIAVPGNTVLKPKMTGYAWIYGKGGTVNRPGTVLAPAEEKVVARVGAVVEEVLVREGSLVKEGELLFKFEKDALEIALESQLIALEKARARLDSAIKDRDALKIISPIGGVVVDLNVEVGDRLSKGDQVAVIADLDLMEVVINVDELEIAKLQLGQQVQVSVDALPNDVFNGIVSDISLEGTAKDGITTYPVTVKVNNPKQSIRSGMTASASIIVARRENVLVVPPEAVEIRGRRGVVQVLVDGQVETRLVEVGIVGLRAVEISAGLSEGEQVVVGSGTTSSAARGMFPTDSFRGMMPGIQPGSGGGLGRR